MSKEKNKGGAPTKYNQEVADKICSEITKGKSLAKISSEMGFCSTNVFRWLRTHEEFCNNYTRAKEEQAELFAEQIIEISDENIDKDVFGKRDAGHVNHNRLRVDARKWVASKLKPKKYGDAIKVESEQLLNPTVNLILNK